MTTASASASEPDRWQSLVAARAAARGVPGATFGVFAAGRTAVAASGVVNRATGVETTADALFQIGSISKVYTATLALRLVEDGLLALDVPVRSVLPELRVADAEVSRRVTLRHLLTHTSGIGGDLLIDVGAGDDALERYVERCAELPQDAPLGALFSYCNAGPAIVGRLVERVCGTTWDAALRERLLDPLGLAETVSLPEDALRFRAALGHVGDPPAPSPVWGVGRALGPSGGICATAADVLAFARLQLDDGRIAGAAGGSTAGARGGGAADGGGGAADSGGGAADGGGGAAATGSRLLRAATVAQLRAPHVSTAGLSARGDAWGLGWGLRWWDGRLVLVHDGTTIGQHAFLRAIPDAGVALVLLTNGGDAVGLAQDLFAPALAEACGLALPPPPAPVAGVRAEPAALRALAGRYERFGERLDVTVGADGGLRGHVEPTGPLTELADATGEEEARSFAILPVDPAAGRWVAAGGEGGGEWSPLSFLTLDGVAYAHVGGRAARRVG